MSGTTVFDVKTALVDALQADSTLSSAEVEVTYGIQSNADTRPRRGIEVGEAIWESEEPVALGNLKRDEKYHIVLVFHSHEPGDEQTEANARVKLALQAVEAILKDPRWSGVAGIVSSGIVPQYLAEGQDSEGRGAILLARVVVTARK